MEMKGLRCVVVVVVGGGEEGRERGRSKTF